MMESTAKEAVEMSSCLLSRPEGMRKVFTSQIPGGLQLQSSSAPAPLQSNLRIKSYQFY